MTKAAQRGKLVGKFKIKFQVLDCFQNIFQHLFFRSSVNQVTANKSSKSDDDNLSAPGTGPVFRIGSEAGGVLESGPAREQPDHHPSILDIDIPHAGLLELTEPPDLMRQESFLTEVEAFQNTEIKEVEDFNNTETKEVEESNETEIKEVEESKETETKSWSSELETQLRPVFDLCQPNSDGLISIEHLRSMCREHGQVRTFPNPHSSQHSLVL